VALIFSGALWIPDFVCTGIWGGFFIFYTGIVIVKKKWSITKFVSIIGALSQLITNVIITGRNLNPFKSWQSSPF
jgi:hypothetical protein